MTWKEVTFTQWASFLLLWRWRWCCRVQLSLFSRFEEDRRGRRNIVFSPSASCPFHFMNIAPNNKGEWALLLTISIVSFEKCIWWQDFYISVMGLMRNLLKEFFQLICQPGKERLIQSKQTINHQTYHELLYSGLRDGYKRRCFGGWFILLFLGFVNLWRFHLHNLISCSWNFSPMIPLLCLFYVSALLFVLAFWMHHCVIISTIIWTAPASFAKLETGVPEEVSIKSCLIDGRNEQKSLLNCIKTRFIL